MARPVVELMDRAGSVAPAGDRMAWPSGTLFRGDDPEQKGRSARRTRAERPRSVERQRGTMEAGRDLRLPSLSRRDGVGHGSDRDADRGRRERGGREGRAPAVGGHRDLPDHAVLTDGRARGRLVRRPQDEPVGRGPAGDRDAERGRRGRGAARGSSGRGAVHDVHGVARPPADDPQHVQDRRRAHAGRDPRRGADTRDARAVDLRGPERRDGGATDRLGDAGIVGRAGGSGPGRGRPHRDARVPRAVPALLRRLPDLARGERDPIAPGRGAARPRRRPPRPGASRARPLPRPPGAPRDRTEPRRVLPGARGLEPLPRDRPAASCRGRWTGSRSSRAARTTCSTTTGCPTPSGSWC